MHGAVIPAVSKDTELTGLRNMTFFEHPKARLLKMYAYHRDVPGILRTVFIGMLVRLFGFTYLALLGKRIQDAGILLIV